MRAERRPDEVSTATLFKPIGRLRADFQQKFCTPRQGALAAHSRAEVELAPEWRGRGILSGIEGFSHIWVISHLHLNSPSRHRGKVHPPRLRGAKVGIMASRSPHRPNNVGLTLARVVSCQGDHLTISEVDLVDGTPILDLKPYLATADRPDEFKCGWTDSADPLARGCFFSEPALRDIERLAATGRVREPERIRLLISEMLSHDPRPPAYLKRHPARFAVWVAGLNVVFHFVDDGFVVDAIEDVTSDS